MGWGEGEGEGGGNFVVFLGSPYCAQVVYIQCWTYIGITICICVEYRSTEYYIILTSISTHKPNKCQYHIQSSEIKIDLKQYLYIFLYIFNNIKQQLHTLIY